MKSLSNIGNRKKEYNFKNKYLLMFQIYPFYHYCLIQVFTAYRYCNSLRLGLPLSLPPFLPFLSPCCQVNPPKILYYVILMPH